MATWLLTKKNHDQHFFRFVRDNGTETSALLETRSMLRHDFSHYCVESTARLQHSFFGMLNAGIDISLFIQKEQAPPISREALVTEMVASILQSATGKEVEPDVLLERITNGVTTMGLEVPGYLTRENIQAMQLQFRLFYERWQAMKTGATMTLPWQ